MPVAEADIKQMSYLEQLPSRTRGTFDPFRSSDELQTGFIL